MDARIPKTKTKIKKALLLILKNKKINEVSITEICKRANVNRNTFYSHYPTPEAVLYELAKDYLNEEYTLLSNCSTTRELVITACKYTKQHAEVNLILLKNNAEITFIEDGIEFSKNTPIYAIDDKDGILSPEDLEKIHIYIVYGAVAIIKKWLFSGMKESAEVIGERIDFITSSLINGIKQSI